MVEFIWGIPHQNPRVSPMSGFGRLCRERGQNPEKYCEAVGMNSPEQKMQEKLKQMPEATVIKGRQLEVVSERERPDIPDQQKGVKSHCGKLRPDFALFGGMPREALRNATNRPSRAAGPRQKSQRVQRAERRVSALSPGVGVQNKADPLRERSARKLVGRQDGNGNSN